MLCTFQTYMKTISMFTQLLLTSVTTSLPQIVLETTEDSIHKEQIKYSELCQHSENQQQTQAAYSQYAVVF